MDTNELVLIALIVNIFIKLIVYINSIGKPKPITDTFFIMFMFDKQEEIKEILEKKTSELKKDLLKDTFDKYLLTKDKLNKMSKDNEKNK